MSRRRMESLGEFEQCVMLAVARLGDRAYGVTIREEVEERTDRDIALGALYTSLGRLELKGYLRSRMSDPTPERGGRSRRYFSLTVTGADALRISRERLKRMWEGLPPNLGKART